MSEQGWQPISTAPKDGTRIDLWAKYWRAAFDDFNYQRFPNCYWLKTDSMSNHQAYWAELGKGWSPDPLDVAARSSRRRGDPPMSTRRSRFRAFRCRIGVHRWIAPTGAGFLWPKSLRFCRDCGRLHGPAFATTFKISIAEGSR